MSVELLEKARTEFEAWNRQYEPCRVTLTVASLDIAGQIGSPPEIPSSLVERGFNVLQQARESEQIRDFRIFPVGPDLLVELVTNGADERSRRTQALRALESAARAILEEAKRNALLRDTSWDPASAPVQTVCEKLNVRSLVFPYSERGAEALFVAKLIKGGPGGFNRMLFNLFFHLDKGSHQRLDGTRFVAVVEHLPSLGSDASRNRRIYLFGDRPEESTLCLLYPFAASPLVTAASHIGDVPEMLSLVANPVEWVISAVYAVRGRFVHDGETWQPTRHEPVALVSIEASDRTIGAASPVCVLRLQSGLPAVGEAHANIGGDLGLTVGAPEHPYHLAVMPVTLQEARSVHGPPGICRVVAYSYQSYGSGRIPPPHDVVDVFAQDPVQTKWLQAEASELAHCLRQHGEFQPYVVAEEAERRAQAEATALEERFEPIPHTDAGEVDTMVQRSSERSRKFTLTDIKADAGGKLGHTSPPALFLAVAKACLTEARELELVHDGFAFAVGDDLHLLMSHTQGIDANSIHLFAFRTFWRAVWVTQLIGYKPYGLAQDLKIGPATKGKSVEDLAQPSERFVQLLEDLLPAEERLHLPALREALARWQRGQGSAKVEKPFSGNVTGQGPGFAEIPASPHLDFAIVAADKAGPAAFNLPLFHAAEAALADPEFRKRYGESIAFEIFDVHRHRRIFLDFRAHHDAIRNLLGATNLFNVKRLWALPQTEPDAARVKQAATDLLLAASTEKLAIIAGGEYVGKDDPVLLGVRPLVEPIFQLMRDGFYLTQGDERGSHYMMLAPKPLHEAVATVRSRGLEVGLRVRLAPQGTISVHDVYAEPQFEAARVRIERLNHKLWTAQGSEFTPIGVGARDVEPAYPLMKVLARITGPDSPYAIAIQAAAPEAA